jgi:hypothetical protein
METNKQQETSLGPEASSDSRKLKAGYLDHLRPYYMGIHSGVQKSRYVLWVDIMGSQGKMLRNVKTAAIPLMKLHVAALNAKKKTQGSVELFPVIDGIYVVSEKLNSLSFFISDVFRSMAAEFLALDHWERSVVRGAIAYGPVILGEECKDASPVFGESHYADSVLIGMPLVQAFTSEKNAPPFGIFVHESVRAFGDNGGHPVTVLLWRWWSKNQENQTIANALLRELDAYFNWCLKNPIASGYAPDRIDAHRALTREYLNEFKNGLVHPSEPKARKTAGKKLKSKPGPDRSLEKLRRILELDDQQVDSIRPILELREEQLKDLSRDTTLDNSLRSVKRKEVLDRCNSIIQGYLTDLQNDILCKRAKVHEASDATSTVRQLRSASDI